MKIGKVILAGASALAIIGSTAWAQEARTGTITVIDRLNDTVAIKPAPSGTTGANTGGIAEEFKVQNGASLETVHAGDKVTFSTMDKDGIKVITTLRKQ